MSRAEDMKRYRRKKREQGLCVYGGCWEMADSSDVQFCTKHWAQSRDADLQRRATPTECSVDACTTIVQRPAWKFCPAHSNLRAYQREGYRVQALSGLCRKHSCSNPPVEGLTLCQKHREATAISNKNRRKAYVVW
jgi:hypothetical protein